MAGQSDAPDDLIAELARLMASESRPDNAPKEAQPRIRIPGSDTPNLPPVPRFDFSATAPAQPAAAPVEPAQQRPVPPAPTPVQQQPAPQPAFMPRPEPAARPQAPAPNLDGLNLRPSVNTAPPPPQPERPEDSFEPFAFDFDLRKAGRGAEAAPSAPMPVEPANVPRFLPPEAPQQPPVARQEPAPAPQRQAEVFARREAPVAPAAPAHVPTPPPVVAAPVAVADETAALDHDSLADLIAAEFASGDYEEQTPAAPVVVEPQPEPEVVSTQDEDLFAQVSQSLYGQLDADYDAPEERPEPAYQVPRFEQPAEVVPSPAADRREPAFGHDPLHDIERLVGPSVRASAAVVPEEPLAQPEFKPATGPLRSLATPTLPSEDQAPTRGPRRRAAPVDTGSVDDAILAAAAASGARVEWVDHSPRADLDEDYVEPAPRQRRGFGVGRAVLGPVLALLLLGVGGGALYFMLGNGGPTGPAPTIVADTAPVKEVPERVEEPAAQSIIFNEMSGGNNGANEQIVPRDQADAETISEATQNSGIGGVISSIDAGTTTPDGLVNRRVRTVTVRPDGTIVSGDSGLAGTSMLPVDRPNVPELPGIAAPTNTATAPTTELAPIAPPTTPAPAPAAPATAPVQAGSVVQVTDINGTVLSGRSVAIPSAKPSDFAATAQAALAAATAAPAAAAPAPVAAPAAPATGTAYVQLSSQRTEQAARESAQAIATRFGVLFNGASLEIQQVNLGDRGIYYRVLVPASSREGAANICTNVKAAGGDCLLL